MIVTRTAFPMIRFTAPLMTRSSLWRHIYIPSGGFRPSHPIGLAPQPTVPYGACFEINGTKFSLGTRDWAKKMAAELDSMYIECRSKPVSTAPSSFYQLLRLLAKDLEKGRTVESQFTEWLQATDFSTCANPTQLIELLLAIAEMPHLSTLISVAHKNKLISFFTDSLNKISFSEWPKKGEVIVQTLHFIPANDRYEFATSLLFDAADEKTNEIGMCLMRALTPRSLSVLYPQLYQLSELLPPANFETLFDCPFPAIGEGQPAMRLPFNLKRPVVSCQFLLIGCYKRKDEFSILAMDKNKRELVWGFASDKEIVQCTMLSNCVALLLAGDPSLYLLNPLDGRILDKVPLPQVPQSTYDEFHVTPSNDCYFLVKDGPLQHFYSGYIQNRKWQTRFQIPKPSGQFHLQGNLGCFEMATRQLIYDRDGLCAQMGECQQLLIEGDVFFILKETAIQQTKLGVSKIVLRPEGRARLLGVGRDGTLLIHLGDDETPYFVDFDKGTLIPLHHPVSPHINRYFDAKTSTLWTWNDISKELWAHTKTHSTAKGILISGRKTHLLHADPQGKLYYIDLT